jgi:hypothetical protein
MSTAPTFLPKPITGKDVWFGPSDIRDLLPPNDLRSHKPSRKAQDVVNDWFFNGLAKLDVTPREGVDKTAALQHIAAILRSFEPGHEEKEWATATLFDLWFSNFTWEAKP